MLKSSFKKLVSLVLVLSLSMALSIPAFAVEHNPTVNQANEVVLQRGTNTETIKLPTNLSKVELTKLKDNMLKYGNKVLSLEEVNSINAKAASSGGLVYGQWFGGYSKYYQASTAESVSFVVAITGFLIPFVGDAEVTAISAGSIAGGLCSAIGVYMAIPGILPSGTMVEATMAKQYREVDYSDGSFAYFQTGFFANDLNVANRSYGSPVTIYSGGLY